MGILVVTSYAKSKESVDVIWWSDIRFFSSNNRDLCICDDKIVNFAKLKAHNNFVDPFPILIKHRTEFEIVTRGLQSLSPPAVRRRYKSTN